MEMAHLYWILCGGAGCSGRESGGGEAPRLTRCWHQQGQAHNQHSNYISTIHVPVVYMARDFLILMRTNTFWGPLEVVGLENRDNERSECHLGPKKSCPHQYSPSYRGRILGSNRDKSLDVFPPCYSQSPLLTEFPPRAKVAWNWFLM